MSCRCLCAIYWSHVLSWECRCSWSSADRRCSNYIWVINKYIAYWGGSNIRDLTVHPLEVAFTKWVKIIWNPLKRNNQIINSSPMVYPVLPSKTYIWLTYNNKSFQLTENVWSFLHVSNIKQNLTYSIGPMTITQLSNSTDQDCGPPRFDYFQLRSSGEVSATNTFAVWYRALIYQPRT